VTRRAEEEFSECAKNYFIAFKRNYKSQRRRRGAVCGDESREWWQSQQQQHNEAEIYCVITISNVFLFSRTL
jgi:hypothetical protein